MRKWENISEDEKKKWNDIAEKLDTKEKLNWFLLATTVAAEGCISCGFSKRKEFPKLRKAEFLAHYHQTHGIHHEELEFLMEEIFR